MILIFRQRKKIILFYFILVLGFVRIHTDTLNETGFVESTLGALKGRTIHMYHIEGAGGGNFYLFIIYI